jgi:hypothetical protein
MLNEQLINKWQPVLDHGDLPEIKDNYRKIVTAHMLENQEIAMREEAHNVGSASLLGESTAPSTIAGNAQNFDPVLISLVRRTAPNLIAFDVMGVQPMSGPTGLVFALRPTYAKDVQGTPATGIANAFYDEANSAFSAGGGVSVPPTTVTGTAYDDVAANALLANTFLRSSEDNGSGVAQPTLSEATGAALVDAEAWGNAGTGNEIPSMSFNIDKSQVTAKTRALKAEYTVELAQDLKAIHGLDAETELANILTTEINAEINREIVRSIYYTAKESGLVVAGTQSGGTLSAGSNDLDGRWLVERFKALVFHIEKQANQIAKETRRGKGNFIICSADVASALATAGVLDPTAALTVDDTGSTFAGTIGAGLKVFIDPYTIATDDFVVVGYKGTSTYDAGLFYCPYVPLQMVRAIGEDNFQPKIGFKTRYGMGVNPFAQGNTRSQAIEADSNRYYRGFPIKKLSGV